MKKKNPWVAAVLNFILPGIGFAYLGTNALVLWGIVYFICTLVGALAIHNVIMEMLGKPWFLGFALLGDFSFAAITFYLTEIFNKSIQTIGEESPVKSL
jgi:hypothetical protein